MAMENEMVPEVILNRRHHYYQASRHLQYIFDGKSDCRKEKAAGHGQFMGKKKQDTAAVNKEITLRLTEEEEIKLRSGFLQDNGQNYVIIGHLSTELGTRESQQDSCYVSVDDKINAIGVVCDGMGGLQGGEIASQQALRTFVEDFEEIRYHENNFYDFFCREMRKIDRVVADLEDEAGHLLSAGTTLVAASIVEDRMQFVSVGDSKLYLIRGDSIRCLNREHNYFMVLKEKLEKGELTEEALYQEKDRGEALISYLGIGNLSIMDANPQPCRLMDGDILILCSDGLYRALTEREILLIVKKNPINLQKTLSELQKEAKEAMPVSQDNTTIVMMSYRKEPEDIWHL